MNNIKMRIYLKAIGTQIILIIAMIYLTPLLANYPVFSENVDFQKQIEPLTHYQQYLLLGTLFITIQTIFIHIIFKKVFIYMDKAPEDISIKETEQIRKICFDIPQKLLISQTTMIGAMLIVLFTIVKISLFLCFKFVVIYFSFFIAGCVLITLFLRNELDKIIVSTYVINTKATIPKKKTKFYITLIKSVVPFFLSTMVVVSLLAYSKIIDINGENKHYYYKQNVERFDLNGKSKEETIQMLNTIALFNDSDYYFIITDDAKYYSKVNGTTTNFFIKYAEFFLDKTDGRIYEYYGVEEEGYGKYVTLDNGEKALVGIKYATSNPAAFYYLLGVVVICVIIYYALLVVSTSNISRNITRVSRSLFKISKKQGIIDKIDVLPALSNDEIGQLVISFNSIRLKIKENVEKIRNSQDMLMERERLASLGQMVGGIAHNLKTPIMSIAGAMEGLEDLIKEYENSISDPEVTIEDHHAIAKDMEEWIKKVNSYDAYMSDIITTVKGQAVNFNDTSFEKFTIDELLKRVDILMKHEIKNSLVTFKVICEIPRETKLSGNVNSLVQIVNNLISNAIQSYTEKPANSKSLIGKNNKTYDQIINLIVSKNKDNIIIKVQDYGCGIPKEVQEKLFKSMITTKGHNGTGLGLFMSYSTMKGHFNGDLTFTSEVGKGTTFTIILPKG